MAALVAGDPRGLDAAYRAYADRLHTYSRFMLHDADAAADVVHDTFVVASARAGQLRDPDRLRPWLYAIARNECLRVLRGRGRHVPLDDALQVRAPDVDPTAGLRAEQVRELVWAAADGLNPGDRQVFELSVRHDLSAADVGAVLGVSTDHAHARLSRVRAHLERAIGALLVARTGAGDCPTLDGLLRGWDGRFTVLLRKRVSRHIEACPTCEERRHQQVRPAALFSAYATLPMLAAPPEVWRRLRLTSADPGQEATRRDIDRRAGRFEPRTGFPPAAAGRRRHRAAAGVAAGVLALLLGGAALVPILGESDSAATRRSPADTPLSLGSAGTPTPTDRVSTGPSPVGPESASPTPTISPGDPDRLVLPPVASPRTASPRAESPVPESSVEPEMPVPLTVDADGRVSCDGSGRYTLTVRATARGGTIDTAVLTWSTGSTRQTDAPMRVTGGTADRQIPRLTAASVTWSVTVTATDGRQASTAPSGNRHPCPERAGT